MISCYMPEGELEGRFESDITLNPWSWLQDVGDRVQSPSSLAGLAVPAIACCG